jgi:hypothetical protein
MFALAPFVAHLNAVEDRQQKNKLLLQLIDAVQKGERPSADAAFDDLLRALRLTLAVAGDTGGGGGGGGGGGDASPTNKARGDDSALGLMSTALRCLRYMLDEHCARRLVALRLDFFVARSLERESTNKPWERMQALKLTRSIMQLGGGAAGATAAAAAAAAAAGDGSGTAAAAAAAAPGSFVSRPLVQALVAVADHAVGSSGK